MVLGGGAITLGLICTIVFILFSRILVIIEKRNMKPNKLGRAILKEYLVYLFISLKRILSVFILFSAMVSID